MNPESTRVRPFTSVLSELGSIFYGLRHRVGDFTKLAPVETSCRIVTSGEISWFDALRFGARARCALQGAAESRAAYRLQVADGATFVTRASVAGAASDSSGVEFTVTLRTNGRENSVREVLIPGDPRRRTALLSLPALTAGTTDLSLTTRAIGNGAGLTTEWEFPHVRYSRRLADLLVSARSASGNWGSGWSFYGPFASASRQYLLWRRLTRPGRTELRAQRNWARSRSDVMSLITFVAAPSDWPSRSTVESVLAQTYPHWEWLIVSAVPAHEASSPATGWPAADVRIRLISIDSNVRARGWNAGIHQAHGHFAALLGSSDALAPSALYEVAKLVEEDAACDLIYSDEEIVGAAEPSPTPRFKPEWSPELLMSCNYVGRLAFIRRTLAAAHDGFREGFEGAEEWDLMLRLSDTVRARRIARCLYTRRDERGMVSSASEAAVIADHGSRHGLNIMVSPVAGTYRSSWPVHDEPRVSIVIPNRDAAGMITRCVRGLLEQTDYPTHDLVIVDNGSTDADVLALYREAERSGRVTIVPFDKPFNYSAACNTGAAAARGELLLFLNNDTEVIAADWLSELVRWAQQPQVGVVGAKLLYPDRTIQHAGVVFGLGLVGHIFSGAAEGADGLFGSTEYYRNYLAVTGACQMIRRDVFDRIGGYDERFRLSFSDVVLCMEAWRAGYRVVYTPFARLIHHESATRGRSDWPEDLQMLVHYLRTQGVVEDPYLHPELNPASLIPALRPPFAPSPRQAIERYLRDVGAPVSVVGA